MKYTPKLLQGMRHLLIRKMGEHPENYVRCPGRARWMKKFPA